MHRFEDILVATSPGHLEPGVLRAAVKLAETNDAGLTVLDVVEPITRMRRFTPVRRATADAQAELVRQRSERLHRLARDAQASDDTDVKVSVGRPFIEVIRHVLEHDNDLVIVGDPKVERQGMPEFPSGVMHLLRKCPVPVWVMRPPQPGTFRILALIDPDSDDPVRDGLNGRVLALATSLARCEAGELHVAHALERAGEPTSQPSPDVRLPGEVTDRPADSADGVREERLGSLLEAHGVADSGAEVHLVAGHAGEVLAEAGRRSQRRVDRDGHGGANWHQRTDHREHGGDDPALGPLLGTGRQAARLRGASQAGCGDGHMTRELAPDAARVSAGA